MKTGNSVVYSLLIGSALVLASQSEGADFRLPPSAGPYVSGNIRANLMDDADLEQVGRSRGGKIKFDNGVGFGVRGGYRFCEWFALEGETGYTWNSVDSMEGGTFPISVDSEFFQVPFMANAVFMIPTRANVEPFFGAGLGGTTSIFDANHIDDGDRVALGTESATSFSYQFFAGLHFNITQQVSVGVIYNFRSVEGPRWDDSSFIIETGQLRNHSIGVSANFRF